MVDFEKLMDPKIVKIDKAEQLFDDNSYLEEPKINGRRIQCLINDDVSFAGRYAREGNENINDFRYKFFKIYDDMQGMGLPKGTLLDGEVYLPGKPVSQTFQIINSCIDDAVRFQETNGFLVYVIFDIISLGGQSLKNKTLYYRKQKLKDVVKSTCNIELINWLTKTTDKQKLWQQILNSNSEEKGVVFKFLESEYENNRSKWWKKLKKFDTYDGVITGFNLHEKYPNDFISSIKVSQYKRGLLTFVANVSGLTKEQSSEFRSKMNFFIGKVVEFRSDSRTDCSYKNPRFNAQQKSLVRIDKQPQSCTWEM